MPESLRDYLDFAVETAYQAGRLTLGYYQTGVRPDRKPDESLVTVADRLTEELIRGRIEVRYRHHAIAGEEHGRTGAEGASHRWYVDPIDGTWAFVRGVPFYAVLIGLEIEGQSKVGAAYFPALDEMVAAASGEGCWWNGRRAHVSAVSSLREALIVSTDLSEFEGYGQYEAVRRLRQAAWFFAGWGFSYANLLVATGRAEVALEASMEPWDNAPFPPILQEAGGYFGDWQGNPTMHGGESLATTRPLLPQVLAVLGEQ
jgi:histidinol-phosphatase